MACSQLQSLVSLHYPQYGQVAYEVREGEDGKASGKITLFGMHLETHERYGTVGEAKEAVAQLGLDLLHELHRILLYRPENDDRLKMLFKPLQEALKAQVAAPMMPQEELELVKMGLPPLVQEERLKLEAEDQVDPSPFNPLLASILRKISQPTQTVPPPAEEAKAEEKATPAVKAEEAFNPVVALHQHWQRRMTSCDQPFYDYFTKQGYFGCLCRYDGHEARAEAHYRTKNGAKLEASRFLCILIFGEASVTFAPVPRDDELDAALRMQEKPAERQVEARAIPEVKAATEAKREAKGAVPVTVGPLQGTQAAEGVIEIQAAASPVDFTLRNGRKFLSLINEYCQIARLPHPEFQFYSGKTLSSYFVCYCDSFLEGDREKPKEVRQRFVSAAFAKKIDAKEDCAARIFAHLEQSGFVDREGHILRQNLKGLVNRKRALDLAMQDHRVRPRMQVPSTMPPMPHLPLPPMPQLPGMPLPPMPPPMLPILPGMPFPPPDPQLMAMLWMQAQMQSQGRAPPPATPPSAPPTGNSSPSSSSLGDLVRQLKQKPSDPRTRQ